MIRRRFIAFTLGALILAIFAASNIASAQAALDVRIRQATLEPDGTTELVASVTGDVAGQTLGKANFTVSEGSKPVADFNVQPLLQSRRTSVFVDLVMDTSGSTAGKPFNDAIAAARSFVNRLPAGVRIGLVSFADTATARAGFTENKQAIVAALNGLRPVGSTALFDAVRLSATRLGNQSGQRNMLVFTDGRDSVNRTTRASAIGSSKAANTPLTVVGLRTTDYDAGALNALASQTNGRYVEVTQSAGLASAFNQVAKEIASQYLISYKGIDTKTRSLDLAVAVNVGAATDTDSVIVINERVAPAAPGQPTGPREGGLPKPPVGFLAGKTGLYVAIFSVFAAVAVFLGLLIYRPGGGQAVKVLQRGLRLYSRGDRRKVQQQETGISSTALGRRAVEIVDKVPRSAGFEQKLQLLLDRAGWPLRASEFVLFQILGLVVGAILGFGLVQRWWVGILLTVFGGIFPRLLLATKVAKRSSDFLSQLPDTLQLLAGSLQAGYAFLQAIDTIVREASPPTSTEFARVLSEARLGMPIEEALDWMAERVGSEDFRWVVLAINIQRQVGGNLAVLLNTVADTLREREQVRRQIKVLSAEGKLSAIILVILPFALAGYIALANPSYLDPLFSTGFGKALVVFAVVMMGIGILWMRKIIKIDV